MSPQFQCYDVGYCLCGATAITDSPASLTADATGQYLTGKKCMIAPYVRTPGASMYIC